MKIMRMGWAIAGGVVLILLVLGVVMFGRYKKVMQSIEQKLAKLDSQVVETPCGEIEYVRRGPEDGHPVLVVHGNAGGIDQGLDLANYIDPAYQLIVPSRFGYLGTPIPENATVEMQADAHACLLDALGIEQAVVFTSSAGVTSSVQLALAHPERVTALILHSPNSPGEVGLLPPPQAAFRGMLSSDFVWWSLINVAGKQFQSLVGVPKDFVLDEEYQAIVDGTLIGVLPSSRRVNGMVFDTYVGNPYINQMPVDQLTVPVLVITAKDDPMTLHERAKSMGESISGAEIAVIEDGGHMMLGHTAEVQAVIKDFLARVIHP